MHTPITSWKITQKVQQTRGAAPTVLRHWRLERGEEVFMIAEMWGEWAVTHQGHNIALGMSGDNINTLLSLLDLPSTHDLRGAK